MTGLSNRWQNMRHDWLFSQPFDNPAISSVNRMFSPVCQAGFDSRMAGNENVIKKLLQPDIRLMPRIGLSHSILRPLYGKYHYQGAGIVAHATLAAASGSMFVAPCLGFNEIPLHRANPMACDGGMFDKRKIHRYFTGH